MVDPEIDFSVQKALKKLTFKNSGQFDHIMDEIPLFVAIRTKQRLSNYFEKKYQNLSISLYSMGLENCSIFYFIYYEWQISIIFYTL